MGFGTLALALLLLAPRPATGQHESEVVLQEMSDADGNRQLFAIQGETADGIPDWSPDREGPPLSIAKAAEIAQAAARKRHPQFGNFEISMIQMHTLSCYPRRPNKWFYVFDMRPLRKGETLVGAMVWEVVLMDGTVVPPQDLGTTGKD